MRKGIYKEHYKFSYKDYNILDVAGFLHRLICGVVGQHNSNMIITSADALLHRVSQYFNEIVDNIGEK